MRFSGSAASRLALGACVIVASLVAFVPESRAQYDDEPTPEVVKLSPALRSKLVRLSQRWREEAAKDERAVSKARLRAEDAHRGESASRSAAVVRVETCAAKVIVDESRWWASLARCEALAGDGRPPVEPPTLDPELAELEQKHPLCKSVRTAPCERACAQMLDHCVSTLPTRADARSQCEKVDAWCPERCAVDWQKDCRATAVRLSELTRPEDCDGCGKLRAGAARFERAREACEGPLKAFERRLLDLRSKPEALERRSRARLLQADLLARLADSIDPKLPRKSSQDASWRSRRGASRRRATGECGARTKMPSRHS
ncbi:MAG: hypothetical protein FJ096_12055 [Deltaproteobacteria bacterium]|nr:hypothetical protein [Deltaproteobacteria bacterium]